MPGIVFLHAGLWPCFAALCVPIVLHLLTRRARAIILLPTFVFLKRSIANQSRMYRVRRPLLLLLRLAALFFLVVAFLKPVTRAPLAQGGPAGRTVVIVLDTSLSMGYTHAGVSSLARVRGPVVQILEDLKIGDRANVVLADARPRSLLPAPGDDYAALVEGVKSTQATLERANLTAALSTAAAQLAISHGAHKELVIASDFQTTNWREGKLDRVPRDVDVVFLNAADGQRENAGITGLTLDPPAPRPGEETNVVAEVWNGSSVARTLPVTMDVRTERRGELSASEPLPAREPASVLVPAFSFGTVRLSCNFPTPGRYLVIARLPGDALKADDVRFLGVEVKRATKVLLLTDESVRADTGAYFLYRALAPNPDAPGDVTVTVKRPIDMTVSDLSGCQAVVWAGVQGFPTVRLALLRRYVSDGGALIVFLSGTRNVSLLHAFAALVPGDSGLPFMPRAPFDAKRAGKGVLTLRDVRYESPLLKVFKDPVVADLSAVRFTHILTTGKANQDAEVLMRFDNGMLAAALGPLGAGTVLLCNFSPALGDSDLARQAIFPPLIHEFLNGMATTSKASHDVHPGDTLAVRLEPGERPASVQALGPSGEPEHVVVDRTSGVALIRRVAHCGFYRFLADGKVFDAVAVNPHAEESDLRSLDPRTLRGKSSGQPAIVVDPGPDSMDRLAVLQHGRPLWSYCLLAVMLLLLLEQAVSATGERVR